MSFSGGLNMKKNSIDMVNGPLLKNLILYSIPIMLTSILQLLFNAADLVVVGRYCGSVSLAAVGATGSISMLVINMFMGLSVGAGVSVAHGLGARNDKAVSTVIHTAIPTAIISGAILTAVGLIIARSVLELMGTPDNVIDLSTTYMRIYFCGMIPSMLYNYGASILRAAGDTKGPLIYLTIAGVINVIMNVFFVVVLKLDVAGVALATAISQAVSAILTTRALMRRTDACKFYISKMHIDGKTLGKIIRIGLPAGIQGSLFAISNVIIQSSINDFGSIAMSGNSSAANIEGFVYVSNTGFSQAALNFVGQNIGAKKYDRVKKVVAICLACVIVVGATTGVLSRIFSRQLLSIYITDSAEAIEYGILRISFCCVFTFINGLMDVMTSALRSMGSSLTPMLISVIGICGFRLTWIFTVFGMEKYHTLRYLYLSYPLSWIISFVGETIAFLILYKKHIAAQNAGTLKV